MSERKSVVRDWVLSKCDELERLKPERSPETLFVSVLYADENTLHTRKFGPYSSDAALFELGCYVLLRIDRYLFGHQAEWRAPIMTVFNQTFDALFAEAFSLPVEEIFARSKSRQNGYAKIFRERGFEEGGGLLSKTLSVDKTALFHLRELILRTKDSSLPPDYDFGKIYPLTTLGLGMLEMEVTLKAWELHVMKSIMSMVEEFCKAVNKSNDLQKISQCENCGQKIRLPESTNSRKLRCPSCKHELES